ncbi:MAG: thiamine pyrophosphate-binding protein [Candidatus Heimdallarchaeota archaeon]
MNGKNLGYSEKKTGAHAVVEALVSERVDIVFGLAGSHVLGIYDCLADTAIRLVSCKHEQNAAFMADMYGRLTGRPGIVIVTAGPGATNSITGVAQAYGAASPMLHISGTVDPDTPKEEFHGVDNPRFLWKMFRDITKWTVQIESVTEIPEMMARAFHIATEGRPGPVHLDIPESLVNKIAQIPPYERKPPPRRQISESEIETIAKSLLAAKNPVIVGGRGILRAFASDKMAKLAELLNAIVLLSRSSISAFPHENSRFAGLLHHWHPNPLVEEVLETADTILGLGLRVGTQTTNQLEEMAASKDFHFIGYGDDTNQLQNSKTAIFADVNLVLSKLLAVLESAERRPPVNHRFLQHIAQTNQLIQHERLKALEPYESTSPLHFGLIVRALTERLAENAIVTIDNGSHTVFTRSYLKIRSPWGYFSHDPWGTMGAAVPGAIAAKIMHPERQVIAITGDGSFLMSCNDAVATAVENDAHIKIFLANNQQYDMIRYMQTTQFGRTIGSEIPPIDFAKFAESFGATGLRLTHPSHLESIIDKALGLDAVVLVDVQTAIGIEYPRSATILERANWQRYEAQR